LRPTNGVGSPVSKQANCWMLVVNDLCKQIVINRCMEIHSDELIQRDFIPISTICSIINNMLTIDLFDSEIVNVSSGVALTLKELANFIADRSMVVLGFRPKINFTPLQKHQSLDKLFISNKKLRSSGHNINYDLTDEIDKLLINCDNWFA
jgi:UDP-glucose 4-epimerase